MNLDVHQAHIEGEGHRSDREQQQQHRTDKKRLERVCDRSPGKPLAHEEMLSQGRHYAQRMVRTLPHGHDAYASIEADQAPFRG